MNDYEKSIPSTNEINTKYKMQSHISHTFIMDFYNRDYFIQYVLQVTRYVWFQYIEFYNFVILYNFVQRKIE